MPAPSNLHELAREAIDPLRPQFPHRLLDLEHRGDAHGPWAPEAVVAMIALAARLAFAADGDDSIWVRTSGLEAVARIDLEWEGALDAGALARLRDAATHAGATLETRTDGAKKIRVSLTLPCERDDADR